MKKVKYVILDRNNEILFNFRLFKNKLDAERFLKYILNKEYELTKHRYEVTEL